MKQLNIIQYFFIKNKRVLSALIKMPPGSGPSLKSTHNMYRKVPKFSDTRKNCCNSPQIQLKRPNLKVFCQKHANGIANSEDPDQTGPLGAV